MRRLRLPVFGRRRRWRRQHSGKEPVEPATGEAISPERIVLFAVAAKADESRMTVVYVR
jgi:hypothetical protein